MEAKTESVTTRKKKKKSIGGMLDGWGKDEIFLTAHKNVIKMIFDRCQSMDEENQLYELLFNKEVASLKASEYNEKLYRECAKVKEAKKRKAAGIKIRTMIIQKKEEYEAERKLYA